MKSAPRLALGLVLALGARAGVSQARAAGLPPVPPRPTREFIREYAALALAREAAGWPAMFRAIAQDGDRLNPAQQRTLDQASADAASTAAELSAALSGGTGTAAICPTPLRAALLALNGSLATLQRDARPPWTMGSHVRLQTIAADVFSFRYAYGCDSNTTVGTDGLPQRPSGPAPPYRGPNAQMLSGAVRDVESGRPLAGATVRVEGIGLDMDHVPPAWYPPKPPTDANTRAWADNEAVAEQVTTATDGGWKFADLPPGCYTLTAYRNGDLARRLITDVTGGHSHPCATYLAATEASAVVASGGAMALKLQPAHVTAMAYGPLVAAHPLAFTTGPEGPNQASDGPYRLSPGGKFFAFVTSYGGDTELWRYDLRSAALAEVGTLEIQGTVELDWRSDTVVTATPAPRNLDFVGEKVGDDHYWVRVESRGHGSMVLTAGAAGGGSQITVQGSRELASAMLDRQRSVVYYLDSPIDRSNTYLAAYDMRGHSTRRRALPRRAEKLLDAVRVPGGALFAFASTGPCTLPAPLPNWHDFNQNQHIFPKLGDDNYRTYVCFAMWPDTNDK